MSNSRVFVFIGPSLCISDARQELEAIYLPPASQGDVYNAARQKPWGIGIIDGYFESVPSVWHKEILWALSQGIHVFGAASMGALRAVETATFGMQGLGRIYEAFRAGNLEDDDEVTVVHAMAEHQFRALSEAMVNIRFTLSAAVDAGVVSLETSSRLIDIGKSLFYPERSWEAILHLSQERGLIDGEIERLAEWLPYGRVDQKRQDARALLKHIKSFSEESPKPFRPTFTLQRTDAWESCRREARNRLGDQVLSPETGSANPLLEEVKVASSYPHDRDCLMARFLALENSVLEGLQVDETLIDRTLNEVRDELGLQNVEDLEDWCQKMDLDSDDLRSLVLREARIRRAIKLSEGASIAFGLADYLRITGRYRTLTERARNKRRTLGTLGLENPSLEVTNLSEEALWEWYFVEHLTIEPPETLESFARAHGFENRADLLRAVIREYCYLRWHDKVSLEA